MARNINNPSSRRQYRYFWQDITLTRMHYVNDATSNRAEVEKAARPINGPHARPRQPRKISLR